MPHALTPLLFAASVAASAVQTPATLKALVESFTHESVFWPQFTIAVRIAERNDPRVLPALASWLGHEDRHLRGNAAFVFAKLGDPRGFQTVAAILEDRSDRPQGQGIPGAPGDGRYRVAQQIAADRYYAAHLLGDLEDPRAIAILVPLLKDADVRWIVPWSLGQIGDKRAVGPLLEVLDADDPSMRFTRWRRCERAKRCRVSPHCSTIIAGRTSAVRCRLPMRPNERWPS